MKILLAMSGGVDSSVVAHLLTEQGHDVIGVRFLLWSDPLAPALAQVLPSKCCNPQTAFRASAVAKQLGIKLHIVDLQDEFKRTVVDPFLEGYSKGLAPNPCIGCNRSIKFGKLLSLADELGCGKLATGHYARVAKERLADGSNAHLLLEAIDQAKDQSYYLYGLRQEQLSRALFPLGSLRKQEVFALAKQYKVPLPQSYIESQDLCFFPEKTPQQFLKRHLKDILKPGEIVRRDGTVVGSHEGLPLYTIGQRRGLGVGGLKIPLEVVAKDKETNRLVVADKGEEQTIEVQLKELRFISWAPREHEDISFDCRTRSLSSRKAGTLRRRGSDGTFRFSLPEPPLASGQSLVFYRGQEIVGGGVIAERGAADWE